MLLALSSTHYQWDLNHFLDNLSFIFASLAYVIWELEKRLLEQDAANVCRAFDGWGFADLIYFNCIMLIHFNFELFLHELVIV